MTTAFKVITGILLGVIAFQFLFHNCESRKWEKSERQLNALLNECLTKDPDTIVKIITQRQLDTVRLRPQSVRVIDTLYISSDTVLFSNEYSGTYTADYLTVRWRAIVFGELIDLEVMPGSFLRYPQVTIQKTVTLPARECEPVRLSRDRWRLYFNPEIYWGDDAVFRVGLVAMGRRGLWGVSGGVQTAFESGHLYYGGGVMIRIR